MANLFAISAFLSIVPFVLDCRSWRHFGLCRLCCGGNFLWLVWHFWPGFGFCLLCWGENIFAFRPVFSCLPWRWIYIWHLLGFIASFGEETLATSCPPLYRCLLESRFCRNIPWVINHQPYWEFRFRSFELWCTIRRPFLAVALAVLRIKAWEMGDRFRMRPLGTCSVKF